MPIETFGLSTRGSERKVNADQFLVADLKKAMTVRSTSLDDDSLTPVMDLEGHVLAVADGISSYPESDRGSALATEILSGYILHTIPWFLSLRPDRPEDLRDELRRALLAADDGLRSLSDAETIPTMATTLSVAYVAWRRLYIAHAGDSRCYLMRGGDLVQLTHDQTLAQALVDERTLTEEQANGSQWSKVLTSVIGGRETDLRVQVKRLELAIGDRLLLCSNGLHGAISDAAIRRTLQRQDSVEAAARHLVRAAQDGDGRDDITAIVARFHE